MFIKKTLGILLGIAVSASVMAADDAGTPFTSGEPITNDAAGCSLLREAVRINLSNLVYGAYACNTASNRIAVATCHPNGQKGAWTVTPMIPDPDWVDPNDGSTAPMIPGQPQQATGGRAYTTSSDGGRVIEANSQNCVVTGGSVTAEAAERAGL
ncbi:hypothetical protein [Thauera sp. SDU_THAU2]|uniref:hypothetical protein n=1 Tax=Thauera sp. SDU_THAU2 TaxID=3136633 RepID=UPI00311F0994